MVSNFIMMNLISQVLKRGFLLSMEQIFNKLFGVDIEDIFVFLVLLEQLLRSHDIFIKHGLNLLISSITQGNSSVIGKLGYFSFCKKGIRSSSRLLTLFVEETIMLKAFLKKFSTFASLGK